MTIKEMNYAILKKYLFIIVIVIDSTKKINKKNKKIKNILNN